MKTLEQIVEGGFEFEAIDGRDKARLARYIPFEHWGKFGIELLEGHDVPEAKSLSRENVIESLRNDLHFAFEKALDQRGISASCMYSVVKMWLWVLDDPLADDDEYAQYGLPLLKKVAVKYGLPNPIGDDHGNEGKYASY